MQASNGTRNGTLASLAELVDYQAAVVKQLEDDLDTAREDLAQRAQALTDALAPFAETTSS